MKKIIHRADFFAPASEFSPPAPLGWWKPKLKTSPVISANLPPMRSTFVYFLFTRLFLSPYVFTNMLNINDASLE